MLPTPLCALQSCRLESPFFVLPSVPAATTSTPLSFFRLCALRPDSRTALHLANEVVSDVDVFGACVVVVVGCQLQRGLVITV